MVGDLPLQQAHLQLKANTMHLAAICDGARSSCCAPAAVVATERRARVVRVVVDRVATAGPRAQGECVFSAEIVLRVDRARQRPVALQIPNVCA